jgi:transposase
LSVDDLGEGSRLREEKEAMARKEPAEKAVRDIRLRTRPRFSGEEKLRIVIEGLRGEESI